MENKTKQGDRITAKQPYLKTLWSKLYTYPQAWVKTFSKVLFFPYLLSLYSLYIEGTYFAASSAMEEKTEHSLRADQQEQKADAFEDSARVIPVVEEHVSVDKRVIETGKVRISKKVSEQQTSVSIPLVSEQYDVERVPVNTVVETPPPAMRYEGDTTIIPVLREVMVVQKKYEIMEEIRITKRKTESTDTQQVSLRKEEVNIERSGNDTNRDAAL